MDNGKWTIDNDSWRKEQQSVEHPQRQDPLERRNTGRGVCLLPVHNARTRHPRSLPNSRHLQTKISRRMHRRHYQSLGSSKRKRHRGLYPLSLRAYRLWRQGKADRSGMARTRQGNGAHRKPHAPRRRHPENRLQSLSELKTLRINQTAQDPAKQFPRHYGRGLGRGSVLS